MSVKHVTGQGTFAGDLRLPGLLHLRVVRSPHAHARVLRIDASAARALPGVAAILTHEDPTRSVPAGPAAGGRRPLEGVVRFVGDRVAAVAAEDPELAQRAADVVRVEYEQQEAVLDPEQALRPGAPVVHAAGSGAPANLAARLEVAVGDLEGALATAERVFEATYRVPAVPASPLEPHLAITWLDEDRRLVVRTSTESPFRVRQSLAEILAIPAARILVIQPQVGGGFGGKSDVVVEDLCALVTLRTGRPARLAYSREEELTVAPARSAQSVRIRVGVRDRELVALDLQVLVDVGAYAPDSALSLQAAAREALSLYRIPHLRFLGQAAFTHRPPTHRNQAALPTLLALESQLDVIAATLDEDPLELRRRHLARAEDTARVAAALGSPVAASAAAATEAMAAGANEIGWSRRWKGEGRAGPRRRGMGMAVVRHEMVGERGAASLQIREDGSFNLLLGTSAPGTGAEEAFAAAAARVLWVPENQVVPGAGDTNSAPFDPGAATPTLLLTGQAVEKAAALLRALLLAEASRRLGAEVGNLVTEHGEVRAPDARAVSYAALAADALASSTPMSTTAFHSSAETPPAVAAVFAEVEVDVDTGEVRVLRVVSALDGGPWLDPHLAEARTEGDALRAVSDVLAAGIVLDPAGRAISRSLRDSPLPTAVDAPEVRTLFVPLDAPATSFGTRPLGEAAATGAVLAIANAVAHAIGAPLHELPLLPERVRMAAEGTDR